MNKLIESPILMLIAILAIGVFVYHGYTIGRFPPVFLVLLGFVVGCWFFYVLLRILLKG